MPATASTKKITIYISLALILLCFAAFWFRDPIWEKILDYYRLFSDRAQIRQFISSFGSSAPPIFMLIQILQVLLAPVPGEATGFIGGYLFGVLPGFIYSSIGLTVGSWLNFVIGRLLGERYVRKLIPADRFEKIDRAVKRQGVIVLFILFLFPGFPKDYLCLALGLSTLPVKLFILLAGFGRMPGTLFSAGGFNRSLFDFGPFVLCLSRENLSLGREIGNQITSYSFLFRPSHYFPSLSL